MDRSRRWRRGLSAGIAATMLFAQPAHAEVRRDPVKDWVCDYRWRQGPREVKRLIRCAARRWRVPGGPDRAIDVARCESRFDPRAHYNGNAGVFQQRVIYWPDRARTWGFPGASVYNGRANVIVSVRMAARSGWDAWSCA
jgi:hypothetical protein